MSDGVEYVIIEKAKLFDMVRGSVAEFKILRKEDAEHIRICADTVEAVTGRKLPWHQVEAAWRPLADALKKEGLMR